MNVHMFLLQLHIHALWTDNRTLSIRLASAMTELRRLQKDTGPNVCRQNLEFCDLGAIVQGES